MEKLQQLKDLFKNKDWFYDVGTEEFNNPVVYVKTMSLNIINEINYLSKDKLDLLPHIHYASSLMEKPYVQHLGNDTPDTKDPYYLMGKMSSLKEFCGANILSDIFYEVHDGKNAITNLSVKFPEVRDTLEQLYSDFGFSAIYELIER